MKCGLGVHRIDRGAVGECALLPSSGVGEEIASARTGEVLSGRGVSGAASEASCRSSHGRSIPNMRSPASASARGGCQTYSTQKP